MAPAGTMTTQGGRAPTRKCGARGHQSGNPCGRGAGWGTPHPGYGQCKLHGGSTAAGIKHAAKEAAQDFAVGMLGAEVEIDPLGALLLAVKLAAGQVAYYRLQMAAAGDGPPSAIVIAGYEQAIDRLGRQAKAALDSGVNERLVRIAERTGEAISLAAEEAMQAADFSVEQRQAFAAQFGRSLARLEEAPLEIEA